MGGIGRFDDSSDCRRVHPIYRSSRKHKCSSIHQRDNFCSWFLSDTGVVDMIDVANKKGGIICCVLLLVIVGILAFIGSQLSSVYFDNGYEDSFDIFVDGKKEGSVAPDSMEKISIKKGEHTIEIRKKDGELFESNDVTLTEFEYIYNIGRKYLYYIEICEYKVGGGTRWGGWATKNIGSETLIKYPKADYGFDEDCPDSLVMYGGKTSDTRTNLKKKINPTAVELSGTAVTVEDVIEVDTDLCRVPYAEECSHKKDCCNLTISGVLDDHYTSTGNYHLSVYVDDIEVFYCDQSPFSHGKPHGRRFSNWKIIKVPVPNHVRDGEKISITLEHTDSPKSDWIGIDYLEFEFDGKIIRKELNEYKNYGIKDGAAGILYGGESQTWEIKLMGADEVEESESHHGTSEDTSLVSYWNFDEDSGGVASDLSGNENDGTIHGAKLVDGRCGTALSFDGVDDYIEVLTLEDSHTSDWTEEAWIKTTDLSAGVIMCKRHKGSQESLTLHIGCWAGNNKKNNGLAYFSDDEANYEVGAVGTTNVADGKWHHLVGVRKSSNFYIYVDGNLESHNNINIGKFALNDIISTDNWHIGHSGAWNVYFNGIIDEVRIYNYALTEDEIKTSMLSRAVSS